MRKLFKSAAAGAGGRARGMAAIQGWEMHCIQVKSNLCCSGLSVACSPRPKDEVSQVDGCCGDLVVIVFMLVVSFKGCCDYCCYELCVILVSEDMTKEAEPR